MLRVIESYPKVPITLVDTCVLAASASFASPKSATFVKNKGELTICIKIQEFAFGAIMF